MASAGPYANLNIATSTHHSIFYRPDALPAAQPTASKHWRHIAVYVIVFNSKRCHCRPWEYETLNVSEPVCQQYSGTRTKHSCLCIVLLMFTEKYLYSVTFVCLCDLLLSIQSSMCMLQNGNTCWLDLACYHSSVHHCALHTIIHAMVAILLFQQHSAWQNFISCTAVQCRDKLNW